MDGQLALIAKFTSSIAMVTSKIVTILIISTLSICRLISNKWFHGGQNYQIRSLIFSSYSDNMKKNYSLYCTVCLSDINGCEKYRQLTNCNHCFHVECIDKWFRLSHLTCPLCRSKVPDHLHPNYQKHKFLFSYILSFSKNFLKKFSGPFDQELTTML